MIEVIRKAIQQYENGQSRTDLVLGDVVAVAPLKIRVDARFEVTEEFIALSPFCREYSITTARHSHAYTDTSDGGTANKTTDEKLETLILWPALQIGEKVTMLRCMGGQLYYVLDRGGVQA